MEFGDKGQEIKDESSIYNVEAVEKKGIRVNPQSHAQRNQPHINPGMRLVMVLGNGLRKIAVDVTKRDDFDRAYASYAGGNFISEELYELEDGLVSECR
ncbi:MAG: hypothetical protein UV76_C0001G0032 [Candidatus Nomurabacteria bacterium GW2011_GWA2_43_15]|uniref:Uncharacterized protein n=1 Tax=Candidatus Nomurabacteria bacterium GW2011_GWA2_43_15 TaxID=1618738 RepID=A0A0G1GRJ3_9BACT|nr:MAG: hypothetical protein UV76_C0001G0032 [Candidatus Nomurabacteria bacterium GW2011_GWA2_43_15]